jgi:hypothetical protein
MTDESRQKPSSVLSLIDPLRVSAAVESGVTLAKTDPSAGLGAVISVSTAMHDLLVRDLHPTSHFTLGCLNAALPISSFSALRSPFDTLNGLAISTPFRATLSTLASVAILADHVGAAYEAPSLQLSLVSEVSPSSAVAISGGFPESLSAMRAIAPPYLASAASVFSVESSFARLQNSLLPSASFPLTVTAPVVTAQSLLSLQNPVLPSASFPLTVTTPVVTAQSLLSLQNPVLPSASFPLTVTAPVVTAQSLLSLQDGVALVSSAAQTVWDAMRFDRSAFAPSAFSLLRLPAVELYASAHVAGVIALPADQVPATDEEMEEVLEDAVGGLETRLTALDRNLVELYRGAVSAIETGGPDWQRHSMTSLRELTTHVLHKLAPDEKMLPKAQPADLAEGRPTRIARLRFIFANVIGPDLGTFFAADMKAAIEMFDLLNSGTHRLGNKASAAQLHYLRGRVAGLIGSMLAARGL